MDDSPPTVSPDGDILHCEGVVDAELRVHGVKGLRVADASIMPRIPTAPTQATTMGIGAAAAELLIHAK